MHVKTHKVALMLLFSSQLKRKESGKVKPPRILAVNSCRLLKKDNDTDYKKKM